MKIPYIKLYTPEVLAATRHLSITSIGEIVVGVCELAFDGTTHFEAACPAEQAFFEMMVEWKKESEQALLQKKLAGKKGGKTAQQKRRRLEESTALQGA